MLTTDILFDKLFEECCFENEKTLRALSDFVDAFGVFGDNNQVVFEAVLTDCILEYQKLAFAVGFSTALNMVLDSRAGLKFP